ncbi:50S ribosomal protein L10, putative [Plasmodium ovale]|nr:50S ribosomal protein L10, putative [Plasmodium ovale]
MFTIRINVRQLAFVLLLFFIYRIYLPDHSKKYLEFSDTFRENTLFISAAALKKNGTLLARKNVVKLFWKKKNYPYNRYLAGERQNTYCENAGYTYAYHLNADCTSASYTNAFYIKLPCANTHRRDGPCTDNRKFSLHSRKCSGYRNTREGKEETVRKMRRILKVTKLLIQLNSFKMTPNLRMDLLINMPRPHVRMHMVKNTMMKLSVKNTPFEAITPHLKESNVYLFIMNENYISFALYRNKMFSSLYKEYKLNNFIKVAVYENTILNKKETEDLINLKSYNVYFGQVVNKINKIITSIPTSIMQIPSSIARGIYLHTQKK